MKPDKGDFQMANDKNRIQYIDIAKGIGIILVVLIHLIFSSDRFQDISYLRNYVYSFHMPLFFIISGYCLFLKSQQHQQERPLKEEIIRLCRKFLPCYFIWSMIYIILLKVTNQPVNIGERVRTTLVLKGIAPLWFLIALFLCELVFLVLHRYFAKKDHYYYLFTLILFVLTILSGYYYEESIDSSGGIFVFGFPVTWSALVLFRSIACLGMLYTGYLLAKAFQKLKIGTITAAIAGLALLGITFILVFITQNYVNLHLFVIGNPIVFILTSICGSTAIILLSYSIQAWGKGFALIGRYSLGIMILHYMPLRLMEYSTKAAFLITTNPYIALLLALVMTLGSCAVILCLLNKKLYLLK